MVGAAEGNFSEVDAAVGREGLAEVSNVEGSADEGDGEEGGVAPGDEGGKLEEGDDVALSQEGEEDDPSP